MIAACCPLFRAKEANTREQRPVLLSWFFSAPAVAARVLRSGPFAQAGVSLVATLGPRSDRRPYAPPSWTSDKPRSSVRRPPRLCGEAGRSRAERAQAASWRASCGRTRRRAHAEHTWCMRSRSNQSKTWRQRIARRRRSKLDMSHDSQNVRRLWINCACCSAM